MRGDTTVALLVLFGMIIAAALMTPAMASHPDEADFTVQPEDPDRAPGERQATYDMLGQVEESYANVTRISYRLPNAAFWNCDEEDLRAFGIDRGGNNPGIETDERPPAQYREFDESYFIYEVNGTVDLAAGDEVIASVSRCLANPEEEGWYQGQFLLYDQNDTTLDSTSHYYWICDCDNESEARERLGPPPSETSTTPNATSTRTPTSTSESTPNETPTSTAVPTAPSTPEGAQTPSPTEMTPTATPDSAPSPTATPTSAESTLTDDASVIRTIEEEGDAPIGGDGAGFGGVAAVFALAVGAMLVRRRG